jgi:DnaJ-class molecular chaperone
MSGLIAEVHSAYNVLSDPEARNRYDATLAREAAMAEAELKATLDHHGIVPDSDFRLRRTRCATRRGHRA